MVRVLWLAVAVACCQPACASGAAQPNPPVNDALDYWDSGMHPTSGVSVPVMPTRVVVDAVCGLGTAAPALDPRSFDAHTRCAPWQDSALPLACHNVTFDAKVRVFKTLDGKITIAVTTAPPTPGWSFVVQLHAPATNVRLTAPSVDVCNGTYTFTLDMACQSDGVYHASVWPSFCRFYDGMDVVSETCGGRIGWYTTLSTADVVASFDQVASRRLYRLDGVEVVVARKASDRHHALHRHYASHRARSPNHLPVCTPEQLGNGIWLTHAAAAAAEDGHAPRETCAPHTDVYTWSPNGCRMRWYSCAQAYAALAAAGATDVAFVGDSRTNHMHRVLTEHLSSCEDGPRDATPHRRDFSSTVNGCAFRLRLLEPFGSSDAIDEMRACPAVVPVASFIKTYAPAKAGMGSTRSHLLALLAGETPPPSVIVVASGGLHDMLAMTHTEAYFDAGVQSAVALLKAHAYNGTVLFHSMPAAHGLMYPFQSYVKQYGRATRAMAAYARAGYRYVDLFPASLGLRSRYFDRSHFYPEPGYGTPVDAYPKTMGCTLAQLVLNGVVEAVARQQ